MADLGTWTTEEVNKLCGVSNRILALRDAEIERLRECLEWLDRRGGLGLDVHEKIKQALTAPLNTPEG